MAPTKDCECELRLEAYSNADFAADKRDRTLLTGGVICLNGMAISSTAKKKGGVSISTIEAEFVVESEQARELLGIREILSEIGRRQLIRCCSTSTTKRR